jgi:hypothetical protein
VGVTPERALDFETSALGDDGDARGCEGLRGTEIAPGRPVSFVRIGGSGDQGLLEPRVELRAIDIERIEGDVQAQEPESEEPAPSPAGPELSYHAPHLGVQQQRRRGDPGVRLPRASCGRQQERGPRGVPSFQAYAKAPQEL